jgi:hypothetical protein
VVAWAELFFVYNVIAASFGRLPVFPRDQPLTRGQEVKIWSVSSRSFHVHDAGEEARPGVSGLSRMCDPLATTTSQHHSVAYHDSARKELDVPCLCGTGANGAEDQGMERAKIKTRLARVLACYSANRKREDAC